MIAARPTWRGGSGLECGYAEAQMVASRLRPLSPEGDRSAASTGGYCDVWQASKLQAKSQVDRLLIEGYRRLPAVTSHNENTGGCLCGAVRYAVAGGLAPAGYCHCSDCRKFTGSAFSVTVPVATANFRLLTGITRSFTTIAQSGNALTRYFCTECCSPIFGSSSGHPDQVSVTAGSFDDPTSIVPGHQGWLVSRVSWSQIPLGIPDFENGWPS